MKYLFYFNTSLNEKMLGILINEALELHKNPDNIILFAYCGGINNMCLFNNQENKCLCCLCRKTIKAILDKYKIENISLLSYYSGRIIDVPQYRSAQNLRNLTYRDVNIGLGIMSSYISQTRNLNPRISNESKRYFDEHVKQNIRFVDSLYQLIDDYQPQIIYGYNGRFEDARAIYDICQKLGIESRLTEDVVYEGKSHRLIFKNYLPHSIKYNVERRNFCWDNYHMSNDEKDLLGKSFYEKRRHGIDTGDLKIYIENQKEGMLPSFDDGKINIAIMNSSEDEYASLGAEWDELKMFKTQYEGIKFLLENADRKVFFYLRIHPNLTNIPYAYHKKLYDLEKIHNNITVIPPESPISTYSLMDKVDKIVTFGSTMGIESVYWGKVSISLGPSLYYYDEVCYHPHDKQELLNYLISDLKPLYNENVIKFGAYMLNKKPLAISKGIIDWNVYPQKFLNYRYSYSPYFSLFFNAKFTAFILGAVRVIFDRKIFRKFSLPLDEE